MQKNSPIFIDIGQGLSVMVGLPTIPSWNTPERPKKPAKGTFGFNTKTKNLEYWDGSDWFEAPMS